MADMAPVTQAETPAPNAESHPDVDPAVTALVKQWCAKVKADKEHHKGAFDRMQTCMVLATHGAEKTWVDSDRYVVPVINRHINQAVAQLYGRNPKAVAKKKKKLYYRLWDGDPQTLMAAQKAVLMASSTPAIATPMGIAMPPEPDPMAVALLEEVRVAKQQMLMMDRLAETMQILFAHFLDEQDTGYKEQFKALVRRGKTCGVSYIKLGFQRRMGRNPDIEAQIADASDQLQKIEVLMQQAGESGFDRESAKAGELKLLLEDLQSKVEIILREGPVLSFPRSREIIPDKRCRHLKTFGGARHVTHEFHMTVDEVRKEYEVDLKKGGGFTAYKADQVPKVGAQNTTTDEELVCIWEIQDKENQQALTIADGYCDFLKKPVEPDVKIERFWTLFPLVFNEVESEDDLFPPSDVWNARHMQREYNNSREGLREHRIAAKPRYVTPKGRLEDADLKGFGTTPAHGILEVNGMTPGDDVAKIVQRFPAANIDPALYETETVFSDIQRTVGSQEANLGGTSGATATETSIAENSRMSASADNVDDLDTVLTQLARAMGQLLLMEMSIETVQEIAGPGAVWPQLPPRREEIVKDLLLEIEAGSSGRPNQAAELAKWERGAPWIVQLPGINPVPFAKKGLALLDIDIEEGIVEGMPSITALNQMAGRPSPAPANDPHQQGGQGGANEEKPAQNEPQSQPAYPGPSAPAL